MIEVKFKFDLEQTFAKVKVIPRIGEEVILDENVYKVENIQHSIKQDFHEIEITLVR
jgi:hypothetical protein